jgi:hypothetical protein
LRAAIALTRFALNDGRDEHAIARLRSIYGWFAEGFDTPDVKEAKALLDDLSS